LVEQKITEPRSISSEGSPLPLHSQFVGTKEQKNREENNDIVG